MGEDSGGRRGGSKRLRRSNLGKPWNKYCGNQRGGRCGERELHSKSQGNADTHSGKSGCWDGDGRRPGGRVT